MGPAPRVVWVQTPSKAVRSSKIPLDKAASENRTEQLPEAVRPSDPRLIVPGRILAPPNRMAENWKFAAAMISIPLLIRNNNVLDLSGE